ncbi:MAG: hypothetical protein V4555_19540 [Acidobacteriota bacterium]
MDKVRFGRALGYGARHAAKSLAQAVDAATTPAPAGAGRPAGTATVVGGGSAGGSGNSAVRQDAAARVAAAARGVAQAKAGSQELKRSVMAPVKAFTSVVWLQVTGTFFTLMALSLGSGLWKLRDALKQPMESREAQEFYVCAAMFLLFAYFAVSNFARAKKRERMGRR